MLIIEIALGIVLAVVVLMFLPQIFSLGIWAAILALGLALVAGVIFLAVEYVTATVALVIAIVIGGIIFLIDEESNVNPAVDAAEKKRRQSLGYDE
jgi:hypothetical protein